MSAWPLVLLRDVLTQRKEFIQIDDSLKYKRCHVQLHAQGIVLRDEVPGAEIKTKAQQICHGDEFLVAEIDAKVGGFGIIPPDLDGAIVSSHYFLFDVNPALLDIRFLGYFVKTAAFRDQVAAQGSTNYAAIRPSHVLAYTIPLPTIQEQRRIVERLRILMDRARRIKMLRQTIAEERQGLMNAARRSVIGEQTDRWIPLRHYVQRIENGWSPACENRPSTGNEWGVLKLGAVSFGSFRPEENKALPISLQPIPVYEIKAGDFLMSRANTTELVGACVLVGETPPQLMLCDKIFRFVFQLEHPLNPLYLSHVLKSPALRSQIEEAATGTSTTMKNISKEKVFNLFVPRHTPAEQEEIARTLSKLEEQQNRLARLDAVASNELDALPRSILNQAFSGQL